MSADQFKIQCDHFCHDPGSGLNPWVRACPVCGCKNPDYDPDAVSDIVSFDDLTFGI
jgi:hypothetical protein